ncbi:hypothetical protein MASR2M78_24780 [Treponema sp.]
MPRSMKKAAYILKLSFRDRELQFYYSQNGGVGASLDAPGWLAVGPVWDSSELSDEYCKFGEFTGTFVGIACVDSRQRKAHADFDWFEYRDRV